MSSMSKQEPLSLNDPSSYGPRWLRERAEARLTPSNETIPEPVRGPIAALSEPSRALIAAHASLDSHLKNAVKLKRAVSNASEPLYPEVIHTPAGLARELERGATLRGVAARFAAAAGVVTIVVLFFFIMVPASRQSNPLVPTSQQSNPLVPASQQSNPLVPASQQSDARSTSSEITGSVRTAVPQSNEGDSASKLIMPSSRQSDAGSTTSEITESVRTAVPQSGQPDDGSTPALAEFQGFLAAAPASPPATEEQSQQLLQQFLQWSQKANSTETIQ